MTFAQQLCVYGCNKHRQQFDDPDEWIADFNYFMCTFSEDGNFIVFVSYRVMAPMGYRDPCVFVCSGYQSQLGVVMYMWPIDQT